MVLLISTGLSSAIVCSITPTLSLDTRTALHRVGKMCVLIIEPLRSRYCLFQVLVESLSYSQSPSEFHNVRNSGVL